jgi:hypothetical protein
MTMNSSTIDNITSLLWRSMSWPIAAALKAPLDRILVRKIGVPVQPELAMGAVVDGAAPVIVRNEEVIELSGTSVRECASELAEIERRRQLYIEERARAEITGQVVIVIDDGIATGSTTRAALQAIRKRNPKELVLAVLVAPPDTIRQLRQEVDALKCQFTLPLNVSQPSCTNTFSAHEFKPPVAIFRQPGCDEMGCEPLAPFALHRHATPYRHNCECNIGASKRYENEGFAPEYSGITTFERIEEIAIPVIQQVLNCQLRARDRH